MNASDSSNIIALRSCIDWTTRISPTVVPEICARAAGHGRVCSPHLQCPAQELHCKVGNDDSGAH